MDSTFKRKLYEACLDAVNEKIQAAKNAVDSARNSANEEERSTAGDKYDTARAMAHIDQDMFSRQLDEVAKLKKVIEAIDINKTHHQVESGALVLANDQLYFIAVSLGKLMIGNTAVMVISPVSPIAQAMLGKKNLESFTFSGKAFEIKSIL